MSLIQLKIKLLILPAFMYNLNFDIWKFGHPQCANSANGAMSKFDISNNLLTRGKVQDGRQNWPDQSDKYEVDMSGVIALCEVLKK